MKKLIFLLVSIVSLETAFAQKETFDLATYTSPKGWKKQTTENALLLSKEDATKGTYCLINLYKTMPGTADSKENFDLAWLSLVKEMVTVSASPEMQPVSTENGWETQSGYAAFESDSTNGIVILATSTAAGKMMNLIVLTNTTDYEKEMSAIIESISLKKIEPSPASQGNSPSTGTGTNSIVGIWGITASDQGSVRVNNGVSGTIFRQYSFNANGTYNFIVKTFDPLMDKILLGKETGTYHVNGNNVVINPKKSVLEAWSKKNGADWGKLLTTQPIPLEKTSYTFTKQFIAEINEWQLILQAGQQTKRDGPFNYTTTNNSWIYIVPSPARPEIKLPEGTQITYEGIIPGADKKKEPVLQATTKINEGGFTFTTTNFDDGWTGVVKEDWVEVTKGELKVLLHYPNEGIKPANSDVEAMCSAAWNVLVAPRYSDLKNYKVVRGVLDYETPYYAEGSLTDNATHAPVFVVLFKKATGWMEFIMPDRKTFVDTFGVEITTISYYAESTIWEKMRQMTNHNKFAIAAKDFTGKWGHEFTGNTYYTNIYTGNSAGMNTYSSSETFEFSANNKYKWSLAAANSRGGASQFVSAKGSGTFTVLNNWQIRFPDMDGKSKTFDAYFSCVKGGRILWMNNAGSAGGTFTSYSRE